MHRIGRQVLVGADAQELGRLFKHDGIMAHHAMTDLRIAILVASLLPFLIQFEYIAYIVEPPRAVIGVSVHANRVGQVIASELRLDKVAELVPSAFKLAR